MAETDAKKEKTAEKGTVANRILTVVLIIVIIFAIIVSYTAYTTKAGSGVPSVFGVRPFAVQTDSMAPFFYSGDLVIDSVVKDPSTLEVGDVITFWTIINGQKVLNTHRIIEITDYGNYLYFDTKGDNNTIADTTGVHQNDIVGVYKTHIPRVGAALDFLQTSKGFFICLVVPVGLFFIYEVISFFKTLMAYNAEKVRLQIIQAQSGKKDEEEDEDKAE